MDVRKRRKNQSYLTMGHNEKQYEMCLQKRWVDFFKGSPVSQANTPEEPEMKKCIAVM